MIPLLLACFTFVAHVSGEQASIVRLQDGPFAESQKQVVDRLRDHPGGAFTNHKRSQLLHRDLGSQLIKQACDILSRDLGLKLIKRASVNRIFTQVKVLAILLVAFNPKAPFSRVRPRKQLAKVRVTVAKSARSVAKGARSVAKSARKVKRVVRVYKGARALAHHLHFRRSCSPLMIKSSDAFTLWQPEEEGSEEDEHALADLPEDDLDVDLAMPDEDLHVELPDTFASAMVKDFTTDMPGDPSSIVEVRPTQSKGWGVFATAEIASGMPLCNYSGESLTQQQYDRRYGGRKNSEYVFKVCPGVYIDASHSEHPSRFFNHAEKSNLVPVVVEDSIVFYTARQIPANGELLFDYGLDYWVRLGVDPQDDLRAVQLPLRRIAARLSMALMAVSVGGVPAITLQLAAEQKLAVGNGFVASPAFPLLALYLLALLFAMVRKHLKL